MKRKINAKIVLKCFIIACAAQLFGDIIIAPNILAVKIRTGKANEMEILYQGKQVPVVNGDAEKMFACMKNQFFYPVRIGTSIEDDLALLVYKAQEEFEGLIYYDEKEEIFFKDGVFVDVGMRPVNKELITVLNQYLDKTF